MTEREFSIQIYAAKGTEPKETCNLIGFPSLLGYVTNFRAQNTTDILRFYTPSEITPKERERLEALGATPTC